MKIIRFISEHQDIFHGVYSPDRPGSAKIIEGDLLGSDIITEREVKIRQLLSPVVPVNILALGINYKKHGDETALSVPSQPILFIKATSSFTGHESPVILPAAGHDMVDYEAELAVIIRKKAKNISPRESMDYIMMSAPGIGSLTSRKDNGPEEKALILSVRWAPGSSQRMKSAIPMIWAFAVC